MAGEEEHVVAARELKDQSYDKWIMLDLWDIPDIYRATIVGKEKLDSMLDILFAV